MVGSLKRRFGSGLEALTYLGQNYLQSDAALLPELLQNLRDEEQFDYCVDITALHYPQRERPFDVIWILYSFPKNERIRVKAQYADGAAVPSAVKLWTTANWLEREVFDMVLSIGAAFAGWGLAWRAYRHAGRDYKEPIAEAASPLYQVLYHKWYVDELYDYLFTGRRKIDGVRLGVMGLGDASSWFDVHVVDGLVNGAGWMTRVAATLSKWWDTWIIDGLCINFPAVLVRLLGRGARVLQWGLVQWYALVMIAGLVGFVFYYAYR